MLLLILKLTLFHYVANSTCLPVKVYINSRTEILSLRLEDLKCSYIRTLAWLGDPDPGTLGVMGLWGSQQAIN